MNYEVFFTIKLETGEVKEGCYFIETDNDDSALEIALRILKHSYAKVEYEILELFAVPE